MDALALVLISGCVLLTAYLTYGRWLSRRVFNLSDDNPTPATTRADRKDFVATAKSVVFGHHFTSIAGTGPIIGPAIAVMWGWLPAILWVILGSIFIGAVHDLSALVISLRHKGRSIGDIAGEILGPRARLLFLCILVVALWMVLAVFGLVIVAVLRQYPAAIAPVLFQIPLALIIGLLIHRVGKSIVLPSITALVLMLASVVLSAQAESIAGLHWLQKLNTTLAAQPNWAWLLALLAYAYIASVLPVWSLLQPRDYINAIQLITLLVLLVAGLAAAAIFGGVPLLDEPSNAVGSVVDLQHIERPELSIVAPLIDWTPPGAPPLLPVLFITIACGACSGFHCLVASGTTSKQVEQESHAKPVGYGAMLTEGFLATLVIAACVAGLSLGFLVTPSSTNQFSIGRDQHHSTGYSIPPYEIDYIFFQSTDRVASGLYIASVRDAKRSREHRLEMERLHEEGMLVNNAIDPSLLGSGIVLDETSYTQAPIILVETEQGDFVVGPSSAYLSSTPTRNAFYPSCQSSNSLANKVGAFVQGAANFLNALSIPLNIAIALMAVFVASFAATTMDTTARLQRYVVQELSRTFLPKRKSTDCPNCAYDCANLNTDKQRAVTVGERSKVAATTCPECNTTFTFDTPERATIASTRSSILNPFRWLATTHGATLFAVMTAAFLALMPPDFDFLGWSLENAGTGGLVLWPIFGAINQLLAGFAFVVILAWLTMTKRPVWFIVPPATIMLLVPAGAMIWQAFIGNSDNPSWLNQENYFLLTIALLALALEVWLVTEAVVRLPRLRALRHSTGV
ncbi:MAG: carbon starvation CstA family protein [Planctomycetota bacterium]